MERFFTSLKTDLKIILRKVLDRKSQRSQTIDPLGRCILTGQVDSYRYC